MSESGRCGLSGGKGSGIAIPAQTVGRDLLYWLGTLLFLQPFADLVERRGMRGVEVKTKTQRARRVHMFAHTCTTEITAATTTGGWGVTGR